MAQNNIESTLHENRHFPPCEDFYKTSALTPEKLDALYAKAAEDHEAFWGDLARQELDWITPFSKILDDSNAPFYKWFADGQLNVSYNCLDRQLKNNAEKNRHYL